MTLEIGKMNTLQFANFTPHGGYLDAKTGNRRDNVLLPTKQIPAGAKEGDTVDVFIYHDSENRVVATTTAPLAQVGQLAYLQVTANTQIGAFLNFGLERGLFLPFSEQRYPLKIGKSYLVYLYLDKSKRISCTTNIYKQLLTTSPYQKNDKVKGTVYFINPQMGAFIAVDNQYQGLIPKNEYFGNLDNGDKIEARVIRVREDGKLDLTPRDLAYLQMDSDAEVILAKMKQNQGYLPLDEKATPEAIEKEYKMSKAAFKRGLGSLLKNHQITKTEEGLRMLSHLPSSKNLQ